MDKKSRLKEILKQNPEKIPAKNIIRDISEDIVTLSELLKEELLSRKIFSEFTDDFISKRIIHENESFSLQELFEKNFINQNRVSLLNTKIIKAKHIKSIKDSDPSYTDDKIINLIQNGEISFEDIKEFMSPDRMYILQLRYKHRIAISNGDLIYTDDKIISLIENNELTKDDLPINVLGRIEHLILEYAKREHINAIKHNIYTDAKIVSLVEDGVLDLVEDIDNKKLLSEERITNLYRLCGTRRPVFPFNWDKFKDRISKLPDLKADGNRIDVYCLGISSAGKSCFLGGLLHYARNIHNKVRSVEMHDSGRDYYRLLTRTIQGNRLPPKTAQEYTEHIPIDFISNKKDKNGIPKEHSFNFIEMPGEVFENAYVDFDKVMARLLNNANRKIFFLVVSYSESVGIGEISQADRMEQIIDRLFNIGVLHKTDAICFLVNKWDLNKDTDSDLTDYVYKNYGAAIEALRRMSDPELKNRDYIPNLSVSVDTFSIGDDFDEQSQIFTYSEDYSKKIFDWLCDIASFVRSEKKPSWIKRFLNKITS